MSIERFRNLIESSTLHFARFDQFSDPWEGVLPPETTALRKDGFTNQPRNPGDTLTDFEMLVRDVNRTNKLCSYANCWFQSEHESFAMWQLYAPAGVAVRSTFHRLCSSVEEESEQVHVGELRYFDFYSEQPPTYGNTLAVAYYKRKQFEHEHELRAVVVSKPQSWTSGSPPYEELRNSHPKFIKIRCNVSELIESVHVAPEQPETLRTEVVELMMRDNLDKPVIASKLDDRPSLI